MKKQWRLLPRVLLFTYLLYVPARADLRAFVAKEGTQDAAAVTGSTTAFMDPGTTATLKVWVGPDDDSELLNFYQVILRWDATPQGGATGSVSYVSGTVAVDPQHPGWVFAGQGMPTFPHETPPPPQGSAGFGVAVSFPSLEQGVPVNGIRYLMEFDVAASADACGAFELLFVPLGGVPQGGSSFGQARPPGGAFPTGELQKLTLFVGKATPAGVDCMRTEEGDLVYDFSENPIPAGFFDPNSPPLAGTVAFKGSAAVPIDTQLAREAGMDFCQGFPASLSVPIQVTQMNLLGTAPVNIDPESEWYVFANVSNEGVSSGTMFIDKTHVDGGVLTAVYDVRLSFMFVRTTNPGDVRFFETAPVTVNTVGMVPWVQEFSNASAQACSEGFFPGVYQDLQEGSQCCRKIRVVGPGIDHRFHLADCSPVCGGGDPGQNPVGACCDGSGECGLSEAATCAGDYKGDGTFCDDSDGDGIPDEAETNDCVLASLCHTGTNPASADTDDDGCSDADEIAAGTNPCEACDPPAGCGPVVNDCNGNGIDDFRDLACGGCDNCDGNSLCDQCELVWCCYFPPFASGPVFFPGTPEFCNSFSSPYTDTLVIYDPCFDPPLQEGIPISEAGTVFTHLVGHGGSCPDPGIAFAQSLPEGPCQPPLIDPWVSKDPNGQPTVMCETFGGDSQTSLSPPIPAGFFAAGTDAWAGTICYHGEPLGDTPYGNFGDADTLIARQEDPFARCALPSPDEVTVTVDVVELNLTSIVPITVTSGSGCNQTDPDLAEQCRQNFCSANPASCEQWNVVVDLSPTRTPPSGQLTATKSHCNGGVYVNSLLVQPRLTFSKVARPATTVELDTGAAGIPPVEMVSPPNQPWVSDLAATTGIIGDECSHFHAGIMESPQQSQCDCNQNLLRDACDIEDAASSDCNANQIPDECEIDANSSAPGGPFYCVADCDLDCNNNGIPDSCDAPDCNSNDAPDECDLAATSADCNNNAVPDECEPDCNANDQADPCDIAQLLSPDCNANGVPDDCEPDCNGNAVADGCDLTSPIITSHDFNENNIPDECETTGCFEVANCCDRAPLNGIRDDACVWCACSNAACENVSIAFADMGGAFGACPPDGFINIHDKFHALICFAGGNPCDLLNIDAGGPFGNCSPDGFCNIHDVNHALTTFAGTNACSCSPSPMPSNATRVAGAARLRVIAPAKARSGELIQATVVLDEPLSDLRGYQLQVLTTGGRRGHLELVEVSIEPRRDYVFAERSDRFSAFNVPGGRMLSGLDADAGVATSARGYLATFTYRVSKDAEGTFVIDIEQYGSQTVLIASQNGEIAVKDTVPAALDVEPQSLGQR